MLETNSDINTNPESSRYTSPFETLSPPSNVSLLEIDKHKSLSMNDTHGIRNLGAPTIKDSLSPISFMNKRPVSGTKSGTSRHQRVGSAAHPSRLDLSLKLADEHSIRKNDSRLVSGHRFKYMRGDEVNSSESPRRGNDYEGKECFEIQPPKEDDLMSIDHKNSTKIFTSIIKELKKQNKPGSSKTRHKVLNEEIKSMELLGSPTMRGLRSLVLSPQENEKNINPAFRHLNKALFNSRPKIQEDLKIKSSNSSLVGSRTVTPTHPLRVRAQPDLKVNASQSLILEDDDNYTPSPSLDILNEKKRPASTLKSRRMYKISKVSQSFECLSQQENHRPQSRPLENIKEGKDETVFLKTIFEKRKPSTAKNMSKNQLNLTNSSNENFLKKRKQQKPSLNSMYINQPADILPLSLAASAANANSRKFSPLRIDRIGDIRRASEILSKKKEEARMRIVEREKQYQSLLSTHIGPSFERVSEKLKNYQALRLKNDKNIEKIRKHY